MYWMPARDDCVEEDDLISEARPDTDCRSEADSPRVTPEFRVRFDPAGDPLSKANDECHRLDSGLVPFDPICPFCLLNLYNSIPKKYFCQENKFFKIQKDCLCCKQRQSFYFFVYALP